MVALAAYAAARGRLDVPPFPPDQPHAAVERRPAGVLLLAARIAFALWWSPPHTRRWSAKRRDTQRGWRTGGAVGAAAAWTVAGRVVDGTAAGVTGGAHRRPALVQRGWGDAAVAARLGPLIKSKV